MKRGFTLIELLVYMAIMGFIIVVAGRAYSDATSMRVRTQNMTRATEEANRIAELLKEDLSQMGAKAWINSDNQGNYNSEPVVQEAYVNAQSGDSSSFELWHRTDLPGGNDSIQFRKISYDSDGKYIGTRLISWALSQDRILRRRCVTIAVPFGTSSPDPEIDACPQENAVNAAAVKPVIMAEDLRAFTLNPSKPLGYTSFGGETTTNNPNPTFGLISRPTETVGQNYFRQINITQPSGQNYNTATLGGFAQRNKAPNLSQFHQSQAYVARSNVGASISDCETFEFKKNETYAIKFKTPMSYNNNIPDSLMALFQPGIDHIAVGFRSSNGAAIPGMLTDFMFYPPQENKANYIANINQYFEFSVPNDVPEACVAFTFAFYSGSDNFGPHMGKLGIKDFELFRKKDSAYEFVRDGSNYEKKDVKAFELILEVNKRNEIGSTRKLIDNEIGGYIIPVPNNGVVPL